MPMSSADYAAWVQAVGSIAAIGVAFFISSKQFREATRLQRENHRDERLRKYEALTGLIEAALDDFQDTLKALRGPDAAAWFETHSTREIMDEFYQAFAQISPLEMPSARAARSLITLRDRIKTATWNANAAMEHTPENNSCYTQCVDAMEHNLNDIRAEQQALLQELRAVGDG